MRAFVLPFLLAIGIALAVAPFLQPNGHETGCHSTPAGNLKQIGFALQMYSQDWDDRLPPMQDSAIAKEALLPYVKNEAIFRHPTTSEPFLPNPGLSCRRLTFSADSVDPEPPISDGEQTQSVAFYEAIPSAENTRAVLFLDGKIRHVPEAEWRQIRPASHIRD